MIAYAKTAVNAVVLCKNSDAKSFDDIYVRSIILLGKTNEDMAHNLYDALRTPKGKELLICAVSRKGIGNTIMDRLERAAREIM